MGNNKYRKVEHDTFNPGYDAMKDLQPLKADAVNVVNMLVIGMLWSLGMLDENPEQWYKTCCMLVVKILALHYLTAGIVQLIARRFGELIQTSENAPQEHYVAEILQTILGFGLVCAPLLAWSTVRSDRGQPTAWKWSLVECMPPFAKESHIAVQIGLYMVQMILGILAFDAFNYFKHRAFHSHLLWPFHKYHHSHRNPSAFTGYAVSPMYSLATFWPLALFAMPENPMYVPIYGTFVVFYLLLNHYLHCGYVLPCVENVLGPCFFMTSVWHNTHHNRGRRGWEKGDQTFAEMLTLWDIWLGTYSEASPTKVA